eukprot:g14407.t1
MSVEDMPLAASASTQVETCEGETSPCAPGLFIVFPIGWRKKTPAQVNRGSKRFIFAAREVDTDGDGKADEIQYQLMGFFGFNLKHSCMLDPSPMDFEKQVKPAWLLYVGNPTNPPMICNWRKRELLLLYEANKMSDGPFKPITDGRSDSHQAKKQRKESPE